MFEKANLNVVIFSSISLNALGTKTKMYISSFSLTISLLVIHLASRSDPLLVSLRESFAHLLKLNTEPLLHHFHTIVDDVEVVLNEPSEYIIFKQVNFLTDKFVFIFLVKSLLSFKIMMKFSLLE